MAESRDQTENLKLLGHGSPGRQFSAPSADILEAFPNRFPGRPYIVSLAFPEFTSLCPVTGQPDFGEICLEYIPDALCVESKSFKLYMFAFRNHHAFMETITNDILNDICGLLSPCWCRVKGLFAPRGATHIHVFAEQFKEGMEAGREKIVREAVAAWRLEHKAHATGITAGRV